MIPWFLLPGIQGLLVPKCRARLALGAGASAAMRRWQMPPKPQHGGVLAAASLHFRAPAQACELTASQAGPRRKFPSLSSKAHCLGLGPVEARGPRRHATTSGIQRPRRFLNAQTSICPAGRPQTARTPDIRETTGLQKPSPAKEKPVNLIEDEARKGNRGPGRGQGREGCGEEAATPAPAF